MTEPRTFEPKQVWQLPPEPADVRQVIDFGGDLWSREANGEWFNRRSTTRLSWEALLRNYGPVTEVVAPRPQVSLSVAVAAFRDHPDTPTAKLRAALEAVGCEVVE